MVHQHEFVSKAALEMLRDVLDEECGERQISADGHKAKELASILMTAYLHGAGSNTLKALAKETVLPSDHP